MLLIPEALGLFGLLIITMKDYDNMRMFWCPVHPKSTWCHLFFKRLYCALFKKIVGASIMLACSVHNKVCTVRVIFYSSTGTYGSTLRELAIQCV